MSKENNGWISVDEKLPKNGQVVLTYDGLRIFICKMVGSKWIVMSGYFYCSATHWQPLPEPPKDIEND